MLQVNVRCVATRRLARGRWSFGFAAARFEALEPRTMMTVSVTDLDPAGLNLAESPWYKQSVVKVDHYSDPVDGLVGLGVYLKADHGEAFTSKLGTFKDADAGSASDYVATVTLDDHTQVAASVVPNSAGGFDVVASTALTWGWHALKVDVSDSRDPSRGTSFDSAAFILAPAISGEAVSLKVRAGKIFDGVVAKYAGIDPDLLDQYQVSIDWGDGQYDANDGVGSVELLDGTNAAIHGRHTYTTPGLHDITVYLTTKSSTSMPTIESGGIKWGTRNDGRGGYGGFGGYWIEDSATPLYIGGNAGWGNRDYFGGMGPASPSIEAKSQITVSKADLVGQATAETITATIKSKMNLARFDVLKSDFGSLANYEAVVEINPPNRYDFSNYTNTPREKVTLSAKLAIDASGRIKVTIDQVFTAAGYYTFTIRINDLRKSGDDAQVGFSRGQFTVAQPLSIDMNTNLPVIGGAPITEAIGHLTVSDGAGWSDSFDVVANVYNTEGSQNKDTQSIPARVVSTGPGEYDVYIDYTPTATRDVGRLNIGLTAKMTRRSTDGTQATPDEAYSAQNDWNDRIEAVYAPAHYMGFEFAKSQSLFRFGSESEERPVCWLDKNQEGFEFELGNGIVGADEFVASDFVAQIEWSDGTTTPIDLEAQQDWEEGDSQPSKDPIFAREFLASAFVEGRGLKTGTVVLTAFGQRTAIPFRLDMRDREIADPTPMPEVSFGTLSLVPFTAVRGQDWEGVIASFIPDDPSARSSDFKIRLWIDGRKLEGKFQIGADGAWDLVARYNFQRESNPSFGWEKVEVSVQSGSVYESPVNDERYQVIVDDTKLNATPEYKQFRQFQEFTTTLAQFDAPNDSREVSDFRATIDWGDGTVSDGVISTRYHGGYDVTGTHKYRTEGSFIQNISIYRGSEYTRTQSSMYINHHPVDVTPDAPESTGLSVSGTIANFVDADLLGTIDLNQKRIKHAALIDWGDGTISTGDLVKLSDGTFAVQGDHTYAQAGDYTVAVTVRQNVVYLPQIRPWFDYQYASDAVYGLTNGMNIFDSAASTGVPLVASTYLRLSVREGEAPVFEPASSAARTSNRERMASLTKLTSDDDVFGSELVSVLE